MASLLLPMAALSLLLSPTSPQCHHARGPSCSKATPAPGTHALGWGFDVTRLELMGRVLGVIDVPSSPSCHLCRDLLAGGRLRRVPRGVARWHSGRRCHQGTQVAQGTMALATAVSAGQEVARGWKVGLGVIGGHVGKGVVALAGSHSRVAEFGLQRQREDRLELLRLRLSCVHYWSWVSPSARPTADFLRALRGLPHRFSLSTAAAFGELVAAYGTHYVIGARAGGRLVSTTALRSCQASLGATGARQVADCLAIEVSAGGGAARAGATANECRRARVGNLGNASFHEAYAERMVEVEGGGGHYDNGDGNTDNHHGDLLYGRPEDFSRWLSSLPTAPGVVGVELRPLHTLLKQGDPRRAALRAAVAHYVTWRGLRINCSHPCGGQRGAKWDGDTGSADTRDTGDGGGSSWWYSGAVDADGDGDTSATGTASASRASKTNPHHPSAPGDPTSSFHKLAERCQCSCVASATVTSSCCSRHRGMGRVTVTVREGEGWRGDHLSATDAYVKAALEGGRGERRTRTLWNQQRPRWDQRLELGVLELPPGTHLRLEVWDSDNGWDDDLLGTCLVTPEPGTHRGLSCFPGGGRLTFDLELTCGPALGGPFCQDYVPQPPSQDGGFYRFSQWPPEPGDSSVGWLMEDRDGREDHNNDEVDEYDHDNDDYDHGHDDDYDHGGHDYDLGDDRDALDHSGDYDHANHDDDNDDDHDDDHRVHGSDHHDHGHHHGHDHGLRPKRRGRGGAWATGRELEQQVLGGDTEVELASGEEPTDAFGPLPPSLFGLFRGPLEAEPREEPPEPWGGP